MLLARRAKMADDFRGLLARQQRAWCQLHWRATDLDRGARLAVARILRGHRITARRGVAQLEVLLAVEIEFERERGIRRSGLDPGIARSDVPELAPGLPHARENRRGIG